MFENDHYNQLEGEITKLIAEIKQLEAENKILLNKIDKLVSSLETEDI